MTVQNDSIAFCPVSLADRQWMQPILEKANNKTSAGCFGTHFMWGRAYGGVYAQVDDMLVIRYGTHKGAGFACPIGGGSLKNAVEQLFKIAAQEEKPLKLVAVTEEQRAALEADFAGVFEFVEDRDSSDYLYTVEKLSTLSGKKLQSKRNHCNRFEKEIQNWRFEPMTVEHLQQCKELLQRWKENRSEEQNDIEGLEQEAVTLQLAFENFETLQLIGGCLYVEDRMVAFTIGEITGCNTVDVHFEKADTEVDGSFAMINREFARFVGRQYPQIEYLNREEDLGIESLRKAKESYRPDILLTKYKAIAKI